MPISTQHGAGSAADLKPLLSQGLAELGVDASPGQLDQLAELSLLLERWAERINLTAHRSAEAIVRRLVLDAAAMLSVLPDFGSLADLGSGAGFPGLPISILRPEARVTLIEAREKRHHFQRAAVRQLDLRNAEPRRGRIEGLDPTPSAAVVAQAVGPWEQVVDWMIRWAEPGGLLIVPSGPEAPEGSPDPRAESPTLVPYRVPLAGPERQIWLAHRASGTPFGASPDKERA